MPTPKALGKTKSRKRKKKYAWLQLRRNRVIELLARDGNKLCLQLGIYAYVGAGKRM